MRITERQLRSIVCEEIVREDAIASAGAYLYNAYKDYAGEKSAQGLSTAQKVGYAASRGALDATPTAARQVAQGNVDFKFTTYWGLNAAQKAIVTDSLATINTFTSTLAIAFPPVAVVPVAVGIVSAALKASDGDLAGGAQDLLGSVLVGAMATGKLSDLLTRRLGGPLAKALGKDPGKFLRAVMGDGASLMPELRLALAKLGGATDLQAAIKAGYSGSVMARGAGVLLKEVVSAIFGKIDGTIANLLVAVSTKSGRADLAKQYGAAKTQALAFLENPAGNQVLLAALAKAGQILPATA
jgi:hypothetical protein